MLVFSLDSKAEGFEGFKDVDDCCCILFKGGLTLGDFPQSNQESNEDEVGGIS